MEPNEPCPCGPTVNLPLVGLGCLGTQKSCLSSLDSLCPYRDMSGPGSAQTPQGLFWSCWGHWLRPSPFCSRLGYLMLLLKLSSSSQEITNQLAKSHFLLIPPSIRTFRILWGFFVVVVGLLLLFWLIFNNFTLYPLLCLSRMGPYDLLLLHQLMKFLMLTYAIGMHLPH